MIHSKRDTEIVANTNPYYLLCDGIPLPLAIDQGIAEAIAFRNEWIATHPQDERDFCGYDENEKNFVGGYEVKNGQPIP